MGDDQLLEFPQEQAVVTQEEAAAALDRTAEASMITKLRRASYYMPDGRKADKVSAIGKVLGESQLLEVWARLAQAKRRGQPAYDALAFRIQEEWGHLKELSRWHVVRALMAYEQQIFGLLGVADSVPELAEWAKAQEKAVKKIIEKVDGLDELAEGLRGRTSENKFYCDRRYGINIRCHVKRA